MDIGLSRTWKLLAHMLGVSRVAMASNLAGFRYSLSSDIKAPPVFNSKPGALPVNKTASPFPDIHPFNSHPDPFPRACA